jgi:hypothetical protein
MMVGHNIGSILIGFEKKEGCAEVISLKNMRKAALKFNSAKVPK